jgi:hypothetical protein
MLKMKKKPAGGDYGEVEGVQKGRQKYGVGAE